MELWLVWVVIGFALVIAELVTGTFYLLVIGVGAFAAALVAWAGGNVLVQSVVGGAFAIVGVWMVHIWHRRQPTDPPGRANFLDRGQPVVLESWANEPARVARVKYRGTTWEARVVETDAAAAPGATLYIEGQEGGMLVVASAPPAH